MDDKCGIYICLEALRRFEKVKIYLATEEETGCKGSSAVDISFFKDCAFLFQADRKEDNEVIKNTNGIDIATEEFMDLCKPIMDLYDYKFGFGTSTDVGCLIKREAGCCGYNFGSGYFQPHSLEEKICISSLENCMNLMFKLADRALQEERIFNYIPKKVVYTPPSSYSRNYGRDWDGYGYSKKDLKNHLNNKNKIENIFCAYCYETDCSDCPYSKGENEEEEDFNNKLNLVY